MFDFLHSAALNIWYVALVVLFFGGSIFVHELGHFLAARWRGLKVDRFSIGFGPKIVSWTRNGVEYRLSWIPLGGYVALPQLADMRGIEGEPETEADRLPPISYTDKMVVSAAGAVFNVIFAFILACVLWVVKQPVNEFEQSTTIGSVEQRVRVSADREEAGPAAAAGLQPGDRILAIDGRVINDWQDVVNSVVMGSGRTREGERLSVFTVERDGKVLELRVRPITVGDDEIRHVGIFPAFGVVVDNVTPDSIAEQLGLQVGDQLLTFGGQRIFNSAHFIDLYARPRSETQELVVRRADGQEATLQLPPVRGAKITGIVRNSIAHRIGLRIDDRITQIDDTPIYGSTQLRDVLGARTNDLRLTVERGAEALTFEVPARGPNTPVGVEFGNLFGAVLVPRELPMIRVGPVKQCVKVVKDAIRTLKSFVDPDSDIGLRVASGPIEIVRAYHMVAQDGLRRVLAFTLLINISLAIFNVLPIPVLDGGHMLFATITKLRNRPISPDFLIKTQSFFMILLLTMILYVSYFNVRRWVNDPIGQPVNEEMIRSNEELTARPALPAAPGP